MREEKYKQWIEHGKKVFLVKDVIKGQVRPCYSLTYGVNEDDAISGTMLDKPKCVEIVSREITPFSGELPSDGFFVGHVKP